MGKTKLRSNYTSTGEKLLAWPEVLAKLKRYRLPTPINLQISPTNACNLNCQFCSVANRDQSLELPLEDILRFIDELSISGTTKAVEITGGGEPTLYPQINELIDEVKRRGFSIGLITNGLQLCNFVPDCFLAKLTWIRISVNTLEDTGEIQIPKVKGPMLGFSYVWGKPGGEDFLRSLVQLSKKHRVEYVRLVPNCLEDVTLIQDTLGEIAISLGPPIFFQGKVPRRPEMCYTGYIKPFLYSDGYVYPCNAVSLPLEAKLDFPKSIAMFHMKEASTWMQTKVEGIQTFRYAYCKSCRFANQNDLLDTVMNGNFSHKEHV